MTGNQSGFTLTRSGQGDESKMAGKYRLTVWDSSG